MSSRLSFKTDGVVGNRHDTFRSSTEHEDFLQCGFKRAQEAANSQNVLLFLIAFRILNALSIKTFFQPDEYFQSLEPAWQIAFGADSGAWITWEWKHQLRSAIHPTTFAVIYWLSSCLSSVLRLSPYNNAELLIAVPKVTQAVFAALGDFYTWKLAAKAYGRKSGEAWVALALTICSPWQWFCSTRTFSNSMETTLTIAALNYWPWQWSEENKKEERFRDNESQGATEAEGIIIWKLRKCFLLAALACILRPTNVLIWVGVATFALYHGTTTNHSISTEQHDFVRRIQSSLSNAFHHGRKYSPILLREAILCGTLMLILSLLLDRLFYKTWTFPPYRFLYFNLAQSLSPIYGQNPWHYYLLQGFPLLLTTYLPFTVFSFFSLFTSTLPTTSALTSPILSTLALTTLIPPLILSLISHKEVRFIYPLLPLLHILTSPTMVRYFLPSHSPLSIKRPVHIPILIALLLTNILLALISTSYHQPAPLEVLTYLRNEYLTHHLPTSSQMTVGFLVPCHSTPWRSHLVYPGIKAWALGCEPPVNVPVAERAAYVDEADLFYTSPVPFVHEILGLAPKSLLDIEGLVMGMGDRAGWDGKEGKKIWPQYLVFFAQLEGIIEEVSGQSGYRECWRGWNGWGNEDWRRRGGIVVWCLRN